ncbi:MAG: hypothetical protein WDO19_30380 [Bacteroidota bacterium]
MRRRGQSGNELWRRANGIDESPVIPFQEKKSISIEHTFQQDTIDMNILHAKLAKMTESIAFELRQQKKVTGCIALKLRYSDGDTQTIQQSIAYCNTDHVLLDVVKELFQEVIYPATIDPVAQHPVYEPDTRNLPDQFV